MPTYEDPRFPASERALVRRRLVSAVIAVVTMCAIASGSAVAAVASAHDDRVDHASATVDGA